MRWCTAPRAAAIAVALAAATVGAQTVAETYTATASVTRGETTASAPITVTIHHYSSAADQAALVAAMRQASPSAARATLSSLGDVGVIEMGGRRTPVKFASARPTGSGRLLTVVTAEPLLHLGAGLPEAPPRDGYDVAVAVLDVREDGAGIGELAPAARVGFDAQGALLIHDYGATVVWLQGLIRAR